MNWHSGEWKLPKLVLAVEAFGLASMDIPGLRLALQGTQDIMGSDRTA